MSLARSCDVIVIGGGVAGTAAALGAANADAQTLLVESAPFLGGAATLKNVLTYCGLFTNYQKKQAVFGVADQVLQDRPRHWMRCLPSAHRCRNRGSQPKAHNMHRLHPERFLENAHLLLRKSPVESPRTSQDEIPRAAIARAIARRISPKDWSGFRHIDARRSFAQFRCCRAFLLASIAGC
jgi:phytoene dehydrogenase-like protein